MLSGRLGPRRVLFHRDFREFSGGHLKVWHYFRHVGETGGYEAAIYFSPESVWDESNPWMALRPSVARKWRPRKADVLFLAGLDWGALSPRERDDPPRPVVNLIQGLRHAHRNEPLHAFLGHPAVRICVSDEVADAVRATRKANGPVIAIPNGLDLPVEQETMAPEARPIDFFIAGSKNPSLAGELAYALREMAASVEVATERVPRATFLCMLRRARVSVFLPLPVEGFFLPALEGMALGTLVVCPDCVGNRSFCLDRRNCYRPRYQLPAVLEACREALGLAGAGAHAMLALGRKTAAERALGEERRRFIEVLDHLDELWPRSRRVVG